MTAASFKKITFYLLIIQLFFNHCSEGQITVSLNSDPVSLAQIMTGYGVQVFNASYKGGRFSAGSFTNSNNNLAIDSGIVLTNGLAKSQGLQIGADGFSSSQASNDLSLPGDADLETLINHAATTHDAAVLEFDFKPAGDTVDFKFVFASEEYPQYNCTTFSDLFAFIIKGPGYIRPKNIALVPGTDVPVAINSINNGIVGSGGNLSYCQMLGPGSPFRQYYVDNSNASIVYNGMTVTLTAGAKVTPCSVYHLKLAIADLSDGVFDSGVFIKANSFNSTYARFEYNGNRDQNNKPFLVEGCNNGSMLKILYSKKVQTLTELMLSFAGTADNQTDLLNPIPVFVDVPMNDSVLYFPLSAIQDNIPEGTEHLKIYVAPQICGNGFNTDSIEIDIKDAWPLTITPPAPSVCPGSSVQFNVVEPGLSNFKWSPSTYLNSFSIINPVCTPLDSITYHVTAEFSPGCRAEGSVFVALKDSASVQISKRDVGCVANSGQIIVTPGTGWTNPSYSINGSAFTANNIFSNLAPGTYIIVVKDASGCVARSTVTIAQIPALGINASVVTTANCSGQNGQIKITAAGGLSPYTYSIDGINFQTSSTFTVPSGIITAYVKDNINCIATQQINIAADPAITFTYMVTPDSCRGLADGTITINATGGSGLFTYSQDGGPAQNQNIFQSVAGVHSITVEDDRGCRAIQDINVPLNNTLTVFAGNDNTVCEGESIQLDAVSNGNTFVWTPSAGLSNASALKPSASPLQNTLYTLVASAGLCTGTDDVFIKVLPAPFTNAGTDTTICTGQTAMLHGSGNGLLTWHPSSLFTNPSLPDQFVQPSLTTTYWLSAEDENGCRSITADSVKVIVLPPIDAFAGNDTLAGIGLPLQLSASGNGNSFLWQPPSGLDDPNSQYPVVTLQDDMTYYLTVTNVAGCSESDTINIKVYKGPEIYVPSAFTPNHDGLNDLLRAIPAGIQTFISFNVYNRWGQLVFSTNDYTKGWDGKINGADQPAGSFVWTASGIDLSGNKLFRQGTVTLIR